MSLIPNRFLFRVAHPCLFVPGVPDEEDEELFDLPEECRLDNFADMDGRSNFADVRLAWNESGLALQVDVGGKDKPPQGDAARPRHSDGITLWVDTRDARTSHRGGRHCHQFHFLAAGGGEERDEPVFVQGKLNRAQQDAPPAPAGSVRLHRRRRRGGYGLTAFVSAEALHGFDPQQSPRLGVFYALRDAELGEQTLSAGPDFPYAEDPTLWAVLELVRAQGGDE